MASGWTLALFILWTAIVISIPVPSLFSRQSNSSALAEPYLHGLAQAQGKLWFGTATDIYGASGEHDNEDYMAVLNSSAIFGQLTPMNHMKFANTEPKQGIFNYTGGDLVVNLAKSTGKKYIRCHNLIWGSRLPDWLTKSQWTNTSLTAIMQHHISSVVQHFRASCYSWDVVNEALASDGTFVPNIWYNTIGREYFFLAFRFAAEAVVFTGGDDVKLYYNDYGIESPNAKTAAAVALVAELQSRRIQIDGVALESHFEVGAMPNKTRQIAAMESFTALGVDVVRSEIDVRFMALPYSAAGLETQRQNYYDTIASCMAVDRCVGMTVWDFADAYSWVPGWSKHTQGGADLYDTDFARKPAYDGVAEALAARTSLSTSPTPAWPTTTWKPGMPTGSSFLGSSSSTTTRPALCNQGSYLHDLMSSHYGAAASTFCGSYTRTTATAVLSYLDGCSKSPVGVDSTCSRLNTGMSASENKSWPNSYG